MKKNTIINSNINNREQEIKTDIYVLRYAEKVTNRKYLRELEVESGIIEQASHMQTAFSFITAGVFMVAPIACEYRGENVSLNTIFFIFSAITIPLLVSLLFATMAHDRKKHDEEADGKKSYLYFLQNEDWFKEEKGQLYYSIQLNIELQKSIAQKNEERLKSLRLSSMFFYVAIFLCFICFIVYLIIM